ncbi:MAG: GDSL-type esterase/lipase family protein, partial [Victivallales bacterium]
PKQWPPLAVKAIKAIRSVDKDTWIVYEPGPGADPSGFRDLMPLPDSHIIYEFHMYSPHAFTHQGLQGYGDEGYGPEEKKIHYPGVIGGIPFNKDYLQKCMQPVLDFQKKWKAPINVGEFSVISWAPPESAAAYLTDVISIFEENGWSWDYHSYADFQGWCLPYEDGFYWRHWKGEQPKLAKTETLRGKVIREALKKNSTDFYKPEFPAYSDPNAAVSPDSFKILIVGNSISRSGFNADTIRDLKWDHTAGMAATSEDKDYVHILAQMIQKTLPDKKLALFFTGFTYKGTPDERLAQLKRFAEKKYDLVIIQHGEHENPAIGGVKGWRATLGRLLGLFGQDPEKPFIICAGVWSANHGDDGLMPGVMDGFWKEIPDIMAELSKEHGVPFVPLMDLAADPANRGWEPKPGIPLPPPPVQWHPNDRGHRLIAEKIFKAFTEEAAKRGLKMQ